MNTKLHAICDSKGRPLNLFVTAGLVSDLHRRAGFVQHPIPNVDWLLGDRGYDVDWFREALKDKGIRARIPGRKQRKTANQVRQAADTSAATAPLVTLLCNALPGSDTRSCLAGSRIGGAGQRATTVVPRSSYQPSHSRL